MSHVDRAATCSWCREPMPLGKRADALTCSKRCRQASHRFTTSVAGGTRRELAMRRSSTPRRPARPVGPMRFAYADPPYPGLSARYYREHPDFAGEVDHAALIAQLTADFPDGWALSTSVAALQDVLALCPPGTLVASWVRGERPARSYRPLHAWEPVLYWGGRGLMSPLEARRVDVLTYTSRPRLTDGRRVIGSKPAAFWRWIFQLLGATPGDEFVDLFEGSGAGDRAWRLFVERT